MDENTRKWRELDALENIAVELWRLRVLKEHELRVRLEESPDGEPYVPTSRSNNGLGPGYPSGCPGLSVANILRRGSGHYTCCWPALLCA